MGGGAASSKKWEAQKQRAESAAVRAEEQQREQRSSSKGVGVEPGHEEAGGGQVAVGRWQWEAGGTGVEMTPSCVYMYIFQGPTPFFIFHNSTMGCFPFLYMGDCGPPSLLPDLQLATPPED